MNHSRARSRGKLGGQKGTDVIFSEKAKQKRNAMSLVVVNNECIQAALTETTKFVGSRPKSNWEMFVEGGSMREIEVRREMEGKSGSKQSFGNAQDCEECSCSGRVERLRL